MIKKWIRNWALKDLVLQVTAEEVFTYTPQGKLFLNGKQLTEGEVKSLQGEIKFLEETRIWKVYQDTIAFQAKQKMFEKSITFDDMMAGKIMLKDLEILRDINKIIKSWKPIPNPNKK